MVYYVGSQFGYLQFNYWLLLSCKLLLGYELNFHKKVTMIIIVTIATTVQVLFFNSKYWEILYYSVLPKDIVIYWGSFKKYLTHFLYQPPFVIPFFEEIIGSIVTGIAFVICFSINSSLYFNYYDWFIEKCPSIINFCILY